MGGQEPLLGSPVRHLAIRKVLLVFYALVNGHKDIEFQLSQ